MTVPIAVLVVVFITFLFVIGTMLWIIRLLSELCRALRVENAELADRLRTYRIAELKLPPLATTLPGMRHKMTFEENR